MLQVLFYFNLLLLSWKFLEFLFIDLKLYQEFFIEWHFRASAHNIKREWKNTRDVFIYSMATVNKMRWIQIKWFCLFAKNEMKNWVGSNFFFLILTLFLSLASIRKKGWKCRENILKLFFIVIDDSFFSLSNILYVPVAFAP